MKIYIDSKFYCHTSNPEGMYREIEAEFFDGKCASFIEGFCYVPDGEVWTRKDGKTFMGEMVFPWKPYPELAATQREYERQLIKEQQEMIKQNEATIAELDAALLDMAYTDLVGE